MRQPTTQETIQDSWKRFRKNGREVKEKHRAKRISQQTQKGTQQKVWRKIQNRY